MRQRLGEIDQKYCEFNFSAVQDSTSDNCALYCLYFAYERYCRFDEEFIEVLNSCYTDDLEENEKRVLQFQKDGFSTDSMSD